MFAKKAHDLRSRDFPAAKLSAKAFRSPLPWFSSLYFYVGLRRDCPELLEEIIHLDPGGETESWIKAFSLSDILLAAYTTPYNVITKGVVRAAIGIAKIHSDVLAEKRWGLDTLPHIHILGLIQYLFKQRYGYEFLKNAMPDAVQEIVLSDEELETAKAYAIFFISNAYKELGGKDNFDFLLVDELKPLPLPIQVYLTAAAPTFRGKAKRSANTRSACWKTNIRSDPKLQNYVTGLFERPASSVRDGEQKRLAGKKIF